MSDDGIATRRRRMAWLLALAAGILVPEALGIFFVDHARSFSYDLEESMEAGGSILNYFVHSVDANRDAMLSNKMARRDWAESVLNHYNNTFNDEYYELTREFEHRNIRKKCINALVTIIIVLIVPSIAYFYAYIFLTPAQHLDRLTKRRKFCKKRILQGLKGCRIRLPAATLNHDERRECPICLSAFSAGEVVIYAKNCHCNIRNGTSHGTDEIDDSLVDIKQQEHRKTCFHEHCILTWLSQRKSNPKKLCPCCRQPFLAQKQCKSGMNELKRTRP